MYALCVRGLRTVCVDTQNLFQIAYPLCSSLSSTCQRATSSREEPWIRNFGRIPTDANPGPSCLKL